MGKDMKQRAAHCHRDIPIYALDQNSNDAAAAKRFGLTERRDCSARSAWPDQSCATAGRSSSSRPAQ